MRDQYLLRSLSSETPTCQVSDLILQRNHATQKGLAKPCIIRTNN